MSIVREIKNGSTFSNKYEFPVHCGAIEDAGEGICDNCPFRKCSEDGELCPAGNSGDGEFKFDHDLEGFVCIEAVKFDLYGGH